MLSLLGLAACSDESPTVTQAAYDEEAQSLCDEHGGDIIVTADELVARPVSDAAKASFLVADFVPNARAIIRSLDGFGAPEANRVQYHNASVAALDALREIEVDAIDLIDRLNADLVIDSENPFIDLQTAFTDLDIPC